MRFRRVARICLAVYWSCLFLGTHLPAHALPGPKPNDKLLHLSGFTGLAFLCCLAWAGRRPTPARLGSVLAILGVYAAFDEWTQSFVSGRKTEFWDWCADMLGSVVGILVYAAVVRIWRSVAPNAPVDQAVG